MLTLSEIFPINFETFNVKYNNNNNNNNNNNCYYYYYYFVLEITFEKHYEIQFGLHVK